ncbi:MAG: hypothetical protein HFG74_00345 [Hungatella sp.]|nr:hypothetical protein [Hungatella sp.]
MKGNLKNIFVIMFLSSINASTACAVVYQPNTDISVEEITTQSSQAIVPGAENPEGPIDQKESPQYDIPENETYVLFDIDDDGYETYVQILNGVMTTDYYTTSPDGKIITLRNEISENDFANIAANSNAVMINSLVDLDTETFYVYEKVNGVIKLLGITQKEVSHDGYKKLEVTVQDLETGNYIPYEDILSNYKK